jgi:hypothetical protein
MTSPVPHDVEAELERRLDAVLAGAPVPVRSRPAPFGPVPSGPGSHHLERGYWLTCPIAADQVLAAFRDSWAASGLDVRDEIATRQLVTARDDAGYVFTIEANSHGHLILSAGSPTQHTRVGA